MDRLPIKPRTDWQRIVESQGFHFHSVAEDDGPSRPYWDESTYYRFTSGEIDELEKASYALNDMCLKAVQHVLDKDLLAGFQIPPAYHDFVHASWENDEHTVYGRFDLAYDGKGPPKLLEYNADTPTALLEAAVVQWYWFKDVLPTRDQFNSIHERLIEIWSVLKSEGKGGWHFASLPGHVEDYITVNYLRDTAMQAGLETAYLPINRIGWNGRMRKFVDEADRPIQHIFKLYPWEWMLREKFGPHLLETGTQWLEAPWKMLLSNKAILPVLWELFPGNPYLLRAAWEPIDGPYVRKPIHGREGANIAVVQDGQVVQQTDGIYGDSHCIYQEWTSLPQFDGNYAVIGSWMVNGYACGIGVREDRQPITQNTSRFVPHVIDSSGLDNVGQNAIQVA
jgi:glutathionylspermidine synthase